MPTHLLTIFLTKFAAINITKDRSKPAATDAASNKLTPVLHKNKQKHTKQCLFCHYI